jgi:hypothetical protein
LVEGVKEMQVACKSGKTIRGTSKEEGKERVSFGTNMSTDDESSASESVKHDMDWIEVVVSKIHASRTAMMNELTKGKRLVMKVQGT